MKKSYLLLALAIFGLTGLQNLLAQDQSFFDYIIVLPNGELTLNTFEDIDGVKLEPKLKGAMPYVDLSSIPKESYVLKRVGDRFLEKLYPSVVCSEEFSSGEDLIAAKFYLDSGSEERPEPIGQSYSSLYPDSTVHTQSFPHHFNTEDSNNPRSERYFYCMGAGYSYVSANISKDTVVSCQICPEKCFSKKINKINRENFQEEQQSHYNTNHRVYVHLYDKILAALTPAVPITPANSQYAAQINYADRTPPHLRERTDDNRFPMLGKNRNITTGDWNVDNTIEITDNRAKICAAKMAYATLDGCPGNNTDWKAQERWIEDNEIQSIELSGDPKFGNVKASFLPNTVHGFMRYSLFLEDTKYDDNKYETEENPGNLNPGCATIEEDNPTECYGLPNGGNLKNTWRDARPWPYSKAADSQLNIKTITGEDRVKDQEGYIMVTDNDLPNILIKLTSPKDGKSITFPPYMPTDSSSEFSGHIINCPDYHGDMNNSNSNEYIYFIDKDIIPESNYENIIKSPDQKPYYTIYQLKPSEFANDSDKALAMSLIGNDASPNDVNMNIRLEDQEYSDNNSEGGPDTDTRDGASGRRNGTWENCVAFMDCTACQNFKIQEDVEYELSVWTDDSVKWTNSQPFFSNPENNTVKTIPTGITSGNITLNIPNQYPPIVDKALTFDPNKSVNKNKIVFREPTPTDVSINSENDLISNNFPSITISVKDFANNTRTIKLYFSVLNENADVRTLQRKHDKH